MDAKECQEKYCQNNDECTAFVYKTKESKCILKRPSKEILSSAKLLKAKGIIFGLRYCSGRVYNIQIVICLHPFYLSLIRYVHNI